MDILDHSADILDDSADVLDDSTDIQDHAKYTCIGIAIDMCCVLLESSCQGGDFEYLRVYARTMDVPSAMPI